jgi:hypothetical protein
VKRPQLNLLQLGLLLNRAEESSETQQYFRDAFVKREGTRLPFFVVAEPTLSLCGRAVKSMDRAARIAVAKLRVTVDARLYLPLDAMHREILFATFRKSR